MKRTVSRSSPVHQEMRDVTTRVDRVGKKNQDKGKTKEQAHIHPRTQWLRTRNSPIREFEMMRRTAGGFRLD